VKTVTSGRKAKADRVWKERPDRDYWTEVIRRIVASSFCTGKNDRGWRADIDFLIRPETHHRVQEGKYDDRVGVGPPTYAKKRQEGNLELLKRVNEGAL
jgi:hypothetical protein